MKIRCDKEVFVRRMAAVSRAVATRPNLEVLNGLHLVVQESTATITGSDLDTTIKARFEVDVEEPGETILPARLATNIVRALNATEVTISVSDDEAVIAGGRSTFNLKTYKADDFPKLSDPTGKGVTVSGTALARGIRQVAGAASEDFARPILTGVLFEQHKGALRMVATDSYRLALCDLAGAGEAGIVKQDQKVIVPAKALAELSRILGDLVSVVDPNEDEKVVVRLAERDIGFEVDDGTGTIQVVTRLIEGDFPKYEALIPETSPRTLVTNKVNLTKATGRVKLMAREVVTPIRMSQRSDGVDLQVTAQDVGTAAESVDGVFTGDDLTIAFNPNYLLEGLEAIDSEEVKLDTTDELKPAVLRPADDNNYLYLLMPVRIT